MPEPEPQGLRERKKVQTRLDIKREAFRLFDRQGYANTTVEQIAEAANVSPRTFYRYFGVKEALLLSDDHIPPIMEAFANAPADLPIIEAYRHGVATFYASLSPEQRAAAIASERMLYEIPEARGLLYSSYVRLIALITDALKRRPDAPADELERRVIAGAIVGILIAASHDNPVPDSALDEMLTILATRLTR
ncbi:TetR family transcriptional regulator [Mycolicibacterium parafortuitum]|uniref:TetR family transcriptional regulator [Catenulispora acidiphila DSM] n=1 Tax=Mycolicibacterium parafortuitum TaxID=39692 RepID=A0A375YGA4_MYCPF|nr:TetR family transcriptional regulator [Mycolicibacterium parafortuitum]ORB28046.1 TetR family transcriptional regulator [Mycolicibacterium parafortuitum]SRX80148.1 TetR family transcriptional regulator [Catenulispora acidiphila DSM] [Mycolicibacterium parafortuitum]